MAQRMGGMLFMTIVGLGCAREPQASPSDVEAKEAPQRAPSPDAAPSSSHRAGASVAIPPGVLRAGSVPGTPHRVPAAEADQAPIELPAFRIDRLPYPNDPSEPPLTGVSKERAQALCRERGQRLCHELEWERACAGRHDGEHPFAPGTTLDVCREQPAGCVAGFDVASMGVIAKEWALSGAEESSDAVLRGGGRADARHLHRCAARRRGPDDNGAQAGFRCCSGEIPDLEYPDPGQHPLARPLSPTPEQLRGIFASLAPLRRFAGDVRLLRREEIDTALRRGGASRESIALWTVAPAAFAWSPAAGEEIWSLSVRAGERVVLAWIYPLADGRFAHGRSLVLEGRNPTAAIAYSDGWPHQLRWTSCWGCEGEGGAVLWQEDAALEVTYR